MLRSCQIPVKFRTQVFFLPSLFKPNLVHFNSKEDVPAVGFICRSDKQQGGAHIAEADTQTRARVHTQRTLTWLATEHWFNSAT